MTWRNSKPGKALKIWCAGGLLCVAGLTSAWWEITSINIIQNLLHTFLLVLTRRFHLKNQSFLGWWSFPFKSNYLKNWFSSISVRLSKIHKLWTGHTSSKHGQCIVHAFVMHVFLLGVWLLTESKVRPLAGEKNIQLSSNTKWMLDICKQTLSKPSLSQFKQVNRRRIAGHFLFCASFLDF